MHQLDHRSPIPYSLSFHILAHSLRFFWTRENHNSFLFIELRSLRPKTTGVRYLLLPKRSLSRPIHATQESTEVPGQSHKVQLRPPR